MAAVRFSSINALICCKIPGECGPQDDDPNECFGHNACGEPQDRACWTNSIGQTIRSHHALMMARAQGCTLVAAHYDPRRKNQGLHASVGASLIKEGVCKRRQAVLQFKNELSFIDRDFFSNLQKAAPDEKEAPMRPQ